MDQVVNKEEGEALAKNYQIQFVEASAKNRHNINDLFMDLSKEIIEYRKTATNNSGINANTTSEPTDPNITLRERYDSTKRKEKAKSNKCC